MQLLLLGASRNIGHHLARLLLSEPSSSNTTLTLLLRRDLPETDALFPHIATGRVKIVKGDALVRDDVERAWVEAGAKSCDAVVFTIGTPMDAPGFGIGLGGVTLPVANLCTLSLLNVLSVIASTPGADPKLIGLSSTGLGPEAHKRLPIAFRSLYGWLLKQAHDDKDGLEHLLHLASLHGPHPLPAPNPAPSDAILPLALLDSLLPQVKNPGNPFSLSRVTIVRPGWLTGNPSLLTTSTVPAYAAEEKLWKPKCISREEVARFLFEECLGFGEKALDWDGKAVDVARLSWF
ncbi:hypothetical protein BDY24DRAFT_376818 [Mrakia frigida]|uniref:uncharacterized protein n=1 Tax=Mrakia frigida TaxID=29902 RepID=UPI003FCC0863